MTPQRHAHRLHHTHTGRLHEQVATHPDAQTTVLQRWLRRWRGVETETRRPLSEQRRLLAIRRLIVIDLGPHSASFTRRDHRLYASLIGAPTLSVLQHLRFELFDLLCRQIGEGAATVRLHEVDVWLSPLASVGGKQN